MYAKSCFMDPPPSLPDSGAGEWQEIPPPSHLELKQRWRNKSLTFLTNENGWRYRVYECVQKEELECPAELKEIHLPDGEVIFETNGKEHNDNDTATRKNQINKPSPSGNEKRRRKVTTKVIVGEIKRPRRSKIAKKAEAPIVLEKPPERPCLFCWKPVPEQKFNESPAFEGETVPGQEHCLQLGRQLQSFFILRKILDIDKSWCEEAFAEDLSFLMDSWFLVCNGCMKYVREAWSLHQKILAFQEKLENVKNKLKKELKEGASKKVIDDDSMDNRIRRAVLSSEIPTPSTSIDERSRIKVIVKREITDDHQIDLSSPIPPATPELMEDQNDLDYDENPITPPTPSAVGSPPSTDGDRGDTDFIPEGFDYDDSNPLLSPPSPPDNGESDEDFVPPPSKSKSKTSSTVAAAPATTTMSYKGRMGRPKGWKMDPNRQYKKLGRPAKPKQFGPWRPKSHPRPDSWKKCSECTFRYNNQRMFKEHLDLHEERKRNNETMNAEMNCIVCTYPATSANNLERHFQRRLHRNPTQTEEGYWKCRNGSLQTCQFVTKDLDEMRTHLFTTDHSMKSVKQQKKLKDEEKKKRQELKMKAKKKEKVAPEPKPKMPKKKKKKKSYRIKVNRRCDTCQVDFAASKFLERHLNLHKERDGKEHPLNCPHCPFPAWQYHELHAHLQKKHGYASDPRRSQSHSCPEPGCDYHAKSYLLLQSHMLTHTKIEEPYIPRKRGRVQGSKNKIGEEKGTKKKKKSNPVPGKTYRCAVCGFSATTFAVVRKHRLSHKNIICEVCGASFIKREYLQAHMTNVHYEAEEMPCPYCRRMFPCLPKMRYHVYRFCRLNPNLKCYKNIRSGSGNDNDDNNTNTCVKGDVDIEVSNESLSVFKDECPTEEQYVCNYDLSNIGSSS